jgi:hypothetical protein
MQTEGTQSGSRVVCPAGFDHARRALLAFVAAYIAFFAISSGAAVWVYVSEIFPTSVRMNG